MIIPLFVLAIITFVFAVLGVTVLFALWTYKDAQVKSEQDPILWLLVVVLLQVPGLIIYLCAGRTKNVPAPGTYKKALIAGIFGLILATAFFIFAVVSFARADFDFAGNATWNNGVWTMRSTSYRNNTWTESVRSGRGSSRRTHNLDWDQMRHFHVESTTQDGSLYLLLQQGNTSSRIDISGDFYGRISLTDLGFTPGRIRMTLQYESVYRSHTIINWRTQ